MLFGTRIYYFQLLSLIDLSYKIIGSMTRGALLVVLAALVALAASQTQCFYPCQTCNGLDPNSCKSCVTGYRLVGTSCVQCTVNYCGTCTDTACQACLPTFVYVPSSNTCVCRQTYIPSGNSTNATCICGLNSSSVRINARTQPQLITLTKSNTNQQQSNTNPITSLTTTTPKTDSCFMCNVSFCLACLTANNICTKCLPTYIIAPNGGCVLYCDIPSCTTCSSWQFCSKCSGGLVPSINGDACITCSQDANCAQCITSNVCHVCKAGFSLNKNKLCVTCNVENCKTCATNNQCDTCATGFQQHGGKCIKCAFPCLSCNLDSTCAVCAYPPYALVPAFINGTAQCFVCQTPHCIDCEYDTRTVCSTCELGYYWDTTSNLCQLSCTIPNCWVCNAADPTQCDTCAVSYYKNNGGCDQCQKGCTACTNSQVCTTCGNGFYLNAGICVPCAAFCATCSSATVCTELTDSHGKTIINIGGQSFVAHCNPGCSQCSSNNPVNCLVCANAFYMQSVGVCVPCTMNSHCQTCDPQNPSNCLSCYPQYFLASDGTNNVCQSCNPLNNCQTCSANDLNTCVTCPQGYLLNSGICVQSGCPIGCVVCSNTTGGQPCNRCLPGFALSSTGVCLPCVTGCNYCLSSSIEQCLNCGAGNLLVNGQCTNCGKYCATCNSIGCTSCVRGAYLTSTFTCALNCVFPCQTCSVNDPTQCSTCVAGYSLGANNVCQSNLNCPNTGGVCPVCPFGSYLNNYVCTPCTAVNCARCDGDPTVCSSCLPGAYYSNGNCFTCSSGCAACTSKSICLSCSSGYTSVNLDSTLGLASCQPCASPCQTCSSSISQCTSCLPTYQMQNGKCISTFNYQFTIRLATDFVTFTQNYWSFLNGLSATVNSDIRRITLNKLVTGSVSATGNITTTSSPQTSDSQTEYSNLDSTLQTGSIGGMSILEYQISANNGDPNLPADSNLVLILAICIPIGVILIVAIVIFVVWRKKKSTNDQLTTKLKDSQGLVSSHDGEQPTHKNLKDSQ